MKLAVLILISAIVLWWCAWGNRLFIDSRQLFVRKECYRLIKIEKPFRFLFYGKYQEGIRLPYLLLAIIDYVLTLLIMVFVAVFAIVTEDVYKAFNIGWQMAIYLPLVTTAVLNIIFRIYDKRFPKTRSSDYPTNYMQIKSDKEFKKRRKELFK